MKSQFLLLLLLFTSLSFSQSLNIDVQHYTNNITVTDSNDTIVGISEIEILFTKTTHSFSIDLININKEGKGMTVSKVLENDQAVEFSHIDDKLNINATTSENETRTYTIHYSGVPADGLIISKNIYDDRTFFSDNWPNRARNWIPCVDHPSDKAFVTFKITAPSHYQVVSNGMLTEETGLSDGNVFYVWKTNVVIPTKVMVIGIAKFAVEHLGDTQNIPLSTWVYPQNKEEGFYDLELTESVLEYFIENFGPYPYQKLSSVQSKTRFGGMENASAIFYPETFITGDRSNEDTMAHEVVHQWFGNSASETHWSHLWLSEGFATYFTNLYMENKYGKVVFEERMKSERQAVLDFAKKRSSPVVDFETTDYIQLLNANSYDKGGWVLHMLHKKVGNDLFWESIRTYYDNYKFSNASTDDLRTVFETVTGQDIKAFFNQWLFTAGHPELSIKKSVEENNLNLEISQKQKSEHTFTFPIEVKLIYKDDSEEIKTLEVLKRIESFSLPLKAELKEIVLDPNTWLLYEDVTQN